MTAHFSERRRTEALLSDVAVVLHSWVSALVSLSWGRFWILIQALFYLGKAEEFTRFSAGIILLGFRCCCYLFFSFCPFAGLQLSIGKLKIVGTRFFWGYKLERSSKECPKKTLYPNILFETVFHKVFWTNARMVRGRKAILFIFIGHSLCKFWVLRELQSANFRF